MANEAEKPQILAFEVTRRCRYDCLHCRADSGSDPGAELTTEQCKSILTSIAQFSRPMIILTGGEPMERDDIYEIIRFGKGLKLKMVMATCGYLVKFDTMAKLKKAGIKVLYFSLDGSSAETHDKFRQAEGAFDAVINAARIAQQAGLRFQINTTISKINIDEVRGIIELAKRLGACCFNAFILVPTSREDKMADEILDPILYEVLLNELLRLKVESDIEVKVSCGPQFARICEQTRAKKLLSKTNGCMGGRTFGFISCRGDVQTCGFLDMSAGNLVENNFDFAGIWCESQFLKKIRSTSDYNGNCGMCEFVGICGGCRARAYTITGDYMAADPICQYRQGGMD
ncbi:MAG: radical SAM protein [Planctomycetota bacterium]|jgi:radical SAM protein with 4Fe4S-binding SPASM domain